MHHLTFLEVTVPVGDPVEVEPEYRHLFLDGQTTYQPTHKVRLTVNEADANFVWEALKAAGAGLSEWSCAANCPGCDMDELKERFGEVVK